MKQLKTLDDFINEHNLPFGLLINQADEPYWLNERIFQLPANWL